MTYRGVVEENLDKVVELGVSQDTYDIILERYLQDSSEVGEVGNGVAFLIGSANRNRRYITKYFKNSGVPMKESYQLDDSFDIQDKLPLITGMKGVVLRYYVQGYSCTDIAKKLNTTVNLVSSYLGRARKDLNNLLGENYKANREYKTTAVVKSRRTFSNPQVRDIRDLHNRGFTIKDIAKKFGVGSTSISNIVNFKTYKEVV